MSTELLRNKILNHDRQEQIRNRWLKKRLETVLPKAMKESGIDMWIIFGREYNEDPVMVSLLPAQMMNAGRLTAFIFTTGDDGTCKGYSLSPINGESSLDEYYEPLWDKERESPLDSLRRFIEGQKLESIGLNYSQTSYIGDGITKTMYDNFISNIEANYREKITSAERLSTIWLETRCDEELIAYEGINQMLDTIIDEMFSSYTIHPGVTSTRDAEIFFMDKVKSLGLNSWFNCDVDLQRKGFFEPKLGRLTIMPGDLLRTDAGLEYLGLKTDTQKLCYVLKHGEKNAPDGIRYAFEKSMMFQDIVCSLLKEGKTGNEVLTESLEAGRAKGLRPCLYSHPIGIHGHGAGPIIGLTYAQDPVPQGEIKIHDNTCYALEFYVTEFIPEWNQDIDIYSEQLIALTGGEVYYIGSRQEELLLVK